MNNTVMTGSGGRIPVSNKGMTSRQRSEMRGEGLYEYVCPSDDSLQLEKKDLKQHRASHGCHHAPAFLLWFALVVSFGVCAVRLSLSTWTRYQENPTVISMEKNYREWNTTFPAATICPSSHYDEHKIQNFVTNSSFGDPGRITEFIKLLSEATYDTFGRLKNYTDVRIPPENYMDIILQVQLELYLIAKLGSFPKHVRWKSGELAVESKYAHPVTYTRYRTRYEFKEDHWNSREGVKIPLVSYVTEMGVCYSYNTNVAPYNNPVCRDGNWFKQEPRRTTATIKISQYGRAFIKETSTRSSVAVGHYR
uniref:Uncharacterized protein n=1 Tax=Timema poppense TaxID=170557 RepID=A0A7R9H7Q7_TIMPO|nr:unnamed protein product [Timema poppensis]